MTKFKPVNAAPVSINLGTKDRSGRQPIYEQRFPGISTPLIFGFAPTGPSDDAIFTSGATFTRIFGDEASNTKGKFATHTTPYLNKLLRNGNVVFFKRVIPDDIGPKATLRISVEVLEDEFNEYEREMDGSFKTDPSGVPITTGQKVKGYTVKFITGQCDYDSSTNSTDYANGRIKAGTTVSTTGQNSKIIPLFDFEAPYQGTHGNLYGLSIYSPTDKEAIPIRNEILEKDKCYPFRVSVYARSSTSDSGRVIDNIFGERFDDFVLKTDHVDSIYGKERDMAKVVVSNYKTIDIIGTSTTSYGPFGSMAKYTENLNALLKLLYTEEYKQVYDQNVLRKLGDDNPDSESFFLFNLFGLTQPDGTPYQTVRFDKTGNRAVFNSITKHWLDGGTDGTMDDVVLAKAVEKELDRFNDPNDRYMDPVLYPFNAFWDSGYPLSVKYKMGKFISVRKDTNVYLATNVSGERALTTSEESARCVSIQDRVRLYIDSEFFNTPAFRGAIVSRSGMPTDSIWNKRLPLTYSFMNIISRFASGNEFNMNYRPDNAANAIIRDMVDINSVWAPMNVRNKDWQNGMIYPEKMSDSEIRFSANKSIYGDDTSVLNTVLAGLAASRCHYIATVIHRKYQGSQENTILLLDTIQQDLNRHLAGIFGTLYTATATVTQTAADFARGYSWTTRIDLVGSTMKTTQTVYVVAYAEDIPIDRNFSVF